MNPESPTARTFETFERLESEVRSYSRSFPTVFERGKGAWLYDSDGRKFLDFLSGCSTLNYGHNHPELKSALLEYIERDGLTHSLDMHSEAKAAFLEAFENRILGPRGWFYRLQFPGPTGANAVEAALKVARKVTGRTNVIAFTNAFHGVTLGALAATGNSHHRGGAGVPLSGVTRVPFCGYHGRDVDTAKQLDKMLSDPSSGVDAPAAIIVETIQGEGGLNVASEDWLRSIAAIARKHGALFIIDDIQAGCGRAGSFFSFDNMGIQPDIITMAKSLSGMGLPLAITLIKPKYDVLAPGEHNGTFRGNCHAFVTATAALETFWADNTFEHEIKRKGELASRRLGELVRAFPGRVRALKGRGMMLGVDVGDGKTAGRIVEECFKRGLVIETSGAHGQIVKVLCPLTISEQDLEKGLGILREATAAVVGKIALVSAA